MTYKREDILPGALSGVRVIEVASMMAGPMAGLMLADHGAEVIKIELPRVGDGARQWGFAKDGHSLMWKFLSRNKTLVTLDLRTPRGGEIFLKLLQDADVLIESFRPGTMERWGLGHDRLQAANERLIVLRVTGFGQTGPSAEKPGFGTLAEAIGGFADINGWPDKPPALPPFGLADALSGITGAFGVAIALRHRELTGRGQEVDLALYEPMLTVLGSMLLDYDQLGILPERVGNVARFSAPRNAFLSQDSRWFVISASNQSTAESLFKLIGHPELSDDPRYATNRARLAHVGDLNELVSAWAASMPADEALRSLEAAGVPAAPIYNAADILSDEHMKARGSVVSVSDPDLGSARVQAPIPRLSHTPGSVRHLGSSQLGLDTEEVLRQLAGVSDAELQQLRRDCVI